MFLTNFYFKEIIGYYYFNTWNEYEKTKNTISFLTDSGFSDKQIIGFLKKTDRKKKYLLPQDLPDEVWSGLIERDKFYLHHALQLRNKPATTDETGQISCSEFYLEINPNFTIESLIEYCNQRVSFFVYEENKIKGAIEYLLEKYKKLPHVTSLDMVLTLIDKAEGNRLSNPLDLQKDEEIVYEELKNFSMSLHERKLDKIVWRT